MLFDEMVEQARARLANAEEVPRRCTYVLALAGRAYPRTCAECKLGPCHLSVHRPGEKR